MTSLQATLARNTASKIGLFAAAVWTLLWFIVTASSNDLAVENYGGAFVAIGVIGFVACLVTAIVTGNKAKGQVATETAAHEPAGMPLYDSNMRLVGYREANGTFRTFAS